MCRRLVANARGWVRVRTEAPGSAEPTKGKERPAAGRERPREAATRRCALSASARSLCSSARCGHGGRVDPRTSLARQRGSRAAGQRGSRAAGQQGSRAAGQRPLQHRGGSAARRYTPEVQGSRAGRAPRRRGTAARRGAAKVGEGQRRWPKSAEGGRRRQRSKAVEGGGGRSKAVEGGGGLWKAVGGCGRLWKAVEGSPARPVGKRARAAAAAEGGWERGGEGTRGVGRAVFAREPMGRGSGTRGHEAGSHARANPTPPTPTPELGLRERDARGATSGRMSSKAAISTQWQSLALHGHQW